LGQDQRSNWTDEEQLQHPEQGLKDDPISEAVVLCVADLADLAVNVVKSGARGVLALVRDVLKSKSEMEIERFAKIVAEKRAAWKPPTQEEIAKVREWAMHGNENIAKMNDEAIKANEHFLKFGNAEFNDGTQGFRSWTPDEKLMMKKRLEDALKGN
jgi:hypothetical protein